MWLFILRRVLYAIPTVFGVAFLLFFLLQIAVDDPAYRMAGKYATPEQLETIRIELGLHKPVYMQFVDYLKQIVTFDFGRSYTKDTQISEMIAEGVVPSLSLTVLAFSLTLMVSITLALIVSYFRGRLFDRIIVIYCVMAMSIPSLAYILAGQYWLAYRWDLFPISGYSAMFPDVLDYVALPALIWLLVGVGGNVRFFRTAILDETYQDYVRTARSKGLDEKVIFFKHVLKNSMVPIITWTVIQIPFLFLGTFLLERFFSIPGLGNLTIDAFLTSDLPVLKAMSIILSILFIIGQLLTDILYRVVDPRVSFK